MKRRLYNFFAVILILSVCLSSNVQVYADKDSTTEKSTEKPAEKSTEKPADDSTTEISEGGEELLKQINKEMNRSAKYDTLVSVYSALKTTGFSDYESAAILVNMNRESSITPDSGQSGGSAIGLIQWDGGRRGALQTFSKKLGDTKYTIKGYKIGDIGTQVAFILEEFLNQNQWDGVAPCNKKYYTGFNYDEAKKAVNDSSIDLSKKVKIEEWRKMTNVIAMSLYFTSQFERCGYNIDIYNLGAKQSPDMYKIITGCDPATESNKETNESIANALAYAGIWGEDEFVEFSELTETPIVFPDRDSLNDKQLKGVVDWRNNIEYENEDVLIKFLRIIVMLFGILFIVWVVLIYLSYWFDRINNFIDVEFLPIITAGRLRVSPEEHECTFNPKNFTKGQAQTVNHKTIISICLIGLFFSVLTISGTLYTVLNFIIRKILSFLGVFS